MIASPTQRIAFRSVPPGHEDRRISKLLMRGRLTKTTPSLTLTDDLAELNTAFPSASNDEFDEAEQQFRRHFTREKSESMSVRDMDCNTNSTAKISALRFEFETAEVANWRVRAAVDKFEDESIALDNCEGGSFPPLRSYKSSVFLINPTRKHPVEAIDSDGISAEKAFASPSPAQTGFVNLYSADKIFVTMALDGYSMPNFSQHKSRQIRKSLWNRALRP
eukprot:GFKZ01001396.1.p2 GENE.GFKZ01001396.1~~GFKZ01001396.1.p2  ORF type:complete len:221 (-),score=23.26 GFKZ01001396.1:1071-1733(-)